jgi:hypothetical protein
MNKPGLLVVAPIIKFYIILIFIALAGCASTGSYTPEGNRITNVEEAFKNGKVRLTCKSFSCVSAYGYNGHKLKELHDNEMWHDLVISVVNIGYNRDLAYYYLGISAEKLGNYDAANIYYTLALAAYISPGRDSSPDRCKVLFINTCLGFVFPEDAQDGLERIKHIVEENNTTGIQKAQAGVFDDFDSGLRVGRDHYGNPIGFITFRDSASSVINISTTSDHPQLPGEEDNNQVLQLDLDAKAWAGVLHRFENAAVDTWTPRDWRGFDGFSFWLYGNNTNKYLFVEILDNRKSRLASHGAELYTYTFTDNFSGWKLITVPFEELARKEIGNDAPNDGLGLSEVHGWAFGTLNTGGSITYYIDDLKILPVKSQPISVDRVWLSPDHTELLLQSSEKNETYYFNNNSDRLCFSFKLPGLWQPSRKSLSLLVIEEPEAHIDLKVGASEEAVVWKGEIGGVWVYSPEELSAHRGVDPVDRASRLIAKIYEEENKAKLTTDKLLPYKSSLPGTKKWKATWSLLIDDQPTQMGAEKIFAEIDPGWVAQISSSNDEIARDILQSLNTSSASDCYTSFIEENFLIE